MKKACYAVILFWGLLLLSGLFFPDAAYAADSNSIERIDMDVSIDATGTAHIKEVWQASVSQGTEGYRPYGNLGVCEITGFSVSDDLGNHYELLDHWYTNTSFTNKAGKCGIVDNGENGIASVQTNELGGNGGSARRKFVDHGYINVGEIAHCQRARNGRSRKHQKMRTASVRHETREC